MIATEMNNKNGKRLFAAVIAMVMIVACAVVVLSENSVAVTYDNLEESGLQDNITAEGYTLTDSVTIVDGETLTIDEGESLTIGEGGLINVNGGSIVNNGTITVSGSNNNSKLSLTSGSITGTGIIQNIGTDSLYYALYVESGTINGITFQSYRMGVVIDETMGGNVTIQNCIFSGGKAAVYIQGTSGDYAIDLVNNTYDDLSMGDANEGIITIDPVNMPTVNVTGDDSVSIYIHDVADELSIDFGQKLNVTAPISDLHVGANVTISIPEGKTLAVENEPTGDGTIAQNGGVYDGPESDMVTGEPGTGDDPDTSGDRYADDDTALGLKNYLTSNFTIDRRAFLSDDLTVASGVTLTIASTGMLDLNGHRLIVEGTVVINNGGSIFVIDGAEDSAIELKSTGAITNNGIIGKSAITGTTDPGSAVKVVYGDSYISTLNVNGISYALKKNVSAGSVTYDLTFSGNAVRTGTGSYELTAYGVSIDGSLTVGNSVYFDATDVTVLRNGTVTINGIATGGLTLESGASVSFNGMNDGNGFVVSAQTGEYITSEGSAELNYTDVTVKDVSGITLTVASVDSMREYEGKNTRFTEQKLVLSGTASVSNDYEDGSTTQTAPADGGSITVSANDANSGESYVGIYVDDTFVFTQNSEDTKNVSLIVSGAKLTVNGQITSNSVIVDGTNVNGADVIGSGYYVTAENGTTTYYLTTFDAALAQIENATSKMVTVYGDLTIEKEYILPEGTVLEFFYSADADEAQSVVIKESGKFTVSNTAVVQGLFDDVEGVLTVIYGGSINPTEPTNYAVKTTNDAGDVTYSGLAVAIANASEGDVITITKAANVEDSLTIPAGITIVVDDNATLTVGKNLTVNGTLTNNGTTSVGGNMTVNGTADSSEGDLDVTGSKSKVTSTGTMTVTPSDFAEIESKISGTVYINDDLNYVITDLASAAEAAAAKDIQKEITVYGTVSESGTVTLDDVNMEIASGATVSVGTIVIDDAELTIPSDATFTGTVTGQSGVEGSTVDSTVVLTRVSALTVSNSSAPNELNETVWSTYIASTATDGDDKLTGALNGTVSVTEGTVTQSGNIVVSDAEGSPSQLTVSSGATYIVPAETKLTSTKGVSVDGTLQVNGNFDSTDATVAGTINVADEATVTVLKNLYITGTMNIVGTEEEQGNVIVNADAVLTIGEKPKNLGTAATGEVVGKITFAAASGEQKDGYVKAYYGADMSSAVFEDSANVRSTEYIINGTSYMTVYAVGANNMGITAVADADAIDLAGLDTPVVAGNDPVEYDIEWYSGETKVESQSVGYYETVSTEFQVSDVSGTISVGNGITMYIDGLTVDNYVAYIDNKYVYMLPVGTHTVSIAANANYSIENATITFNGVTVANGGTFTIEAGATTFTLATSGATAQSPSITIDGGNNGDSGMGLTDYLLIILVILIVVMAIIVALRLMRS